MMFRPPLHYSATRSMFQISQNSICWGCWGFTKEWPLASEFSEFKYSPEICHFWRIQVLAKMAFFGNVSDWPDLPTFAKPCCTDSPDLPKFAKPFCADSPDSRKASLASFRQILRVQARPFYTYKICYLCIKRPIFLGPAFIKRLVKYLPDLPTFAKPCCTDWPDLPTFTKPCCTDSPDSRHLPSHVAQTCQTCRHSPKAIFEKNVTRLNTFARVMSESREFGASGHCLGFTQY